MYVCMLLCKCLVQYRSQLTGLPQAYDLLYEQHCVVQLHGGNSDVVCDYMSNELYFDVC